MKTHVALLLALSTSIAIFPVYRHHGTTTRGDFQKLETLSTLIANGNLDDAATIIDEKLHLALVPLDNENNTFVHHSAYHGKLDIIKNIVAHIDFSNDELRTTRGLTPKDSAQAGLEELDDPTYTEDYDDSRDCNQLAIMSKTEVKRRYNEIIKILS